MSGDKCVFSILPLSFECAKAIHLPCIGQLEKLTSLNGVYQTFECEHVIDLLLIRGGIVVDWSDGNKVNEVLEMLVCSNHKSNLLTSWKFNKFANKVNNRNQRTCSIHKIQHSQGSKPVSYRTLSKSNAMRLIEATGRFFHVGTGICKQHHDAICGLKFECFSFSDQIGIAKDSNQNVVDEPDDDLARFDALIDENDTHLDSESVYAPSLHDETDQDPPHSDTKDQRANALRDIAALFGLSRLTSERNWTSLKLETRRRKVSSMLHLQDELFKLSAGSEWELMKRECIIKTGQITDSSRVTNILQSIDERLEETTDRRARLSLVSIMTGHFTEREITHATGVSRYYIREAKKFALYGSYRNTAVVHTLHVTAAKYGVTLIAYLFSEPQYGKGAADRQISHSKRKLMDEVDKGGYGRTAEEILKSLCTEPLLKSFSFYTIKGNQVKRAEGTIPDITTLSSFRYEKEGIRVRKFDTIGDGVLISYDKLEPVEVDYEIISSGGHLSMSPSFWGELSDTPPKKKETKVSNEENEEEEADKKFRCTEGNCTMKYTTMHGLSKHMLVGKHKEREHSDTIIDAAAKIFSESVETNEKAYLSMMSDSFSSSLSHVRSLKLTEGWSLREKRKIIPIDPEVRRIVRKYFVGRRKEGKRAEARFVVRMLREKTGADGSYVFPLNVCLKESQAQGLIGRFLKVESSKKGLAALESDSEEAIEEEEREDGSDIEAEIADTLAGQTEKKGKGRSRKIELISHSETKRSERKVKRSVSKKSAGRSKKLVLSDQEDDCEETDEKKSDEEEDTEALLVIKKETTAKKRGRPSKIALETVTVEKKERGRKKKNDTAKTSVTSSSIRVLRDRKRKSEEERINYEEISSADELDDYTLMMNAVMEGDNFKEIFSDEE